MNNKPHHLYRHSDAEGRLLYIGTSLSAFTRLSRHKTSSTWANEALYMKTESFDNKALALAAEKHAIKTEYPKFNKHHNNGSRPEGLYRALICSFTRNNVSGISIDNSLHTDDRQAMCNVDKQIFDVAGNALKLYKIVGFEHWVGRPIEIEVNALLDILEFKYTFQYYEDFRRLVLDPAFEMITMYSDKSISYIEKITDKSVTHVVFTYNLKSAPLPTYLEIRAANLKQEQISLNKLGRDWLFF